MDAKLALGVDVGGTKVAAGIVDREGTIVKSSRVPMNAKGSAEEGLAAVTAAIDALFREGGRLEEQVRGIGVCAPGPLDPTTGVVINPPNVTCWRNFPLAAKITSRYGVPVKIDNDANAAGLAEVLWGAGRGYQNVFYACIGTGIGTGIVFDGRIYHGRTGAAAEGGHVSIDYNGPLCGCGKRGCIEVLASGTAIGRRARAKVASDPARGAALLELAGGEADAVTSEMVGQACLAGDPLATECLRETVELISVWLGNVVDLIEPDVLIIGGGVAAMLAPFFGEMRERLAVWCVNSRAREIPLVPAHYGASSGIAGGAAICQ
ncbi:MAG TPA: ROK family protein [Candidatus Saccharimonadales bacterium]|nr:ROK family protein [Candidatus Saccharimonadales bacterium]